MNKTVFDGNASFGVSSVHIRFLIYYTYNWITENQVGSHPDLV